MRQTQWIPMVAQAALVAMVLVVAAGCSRVDPARERVNDAYAERLSAQAQAYQQEQARSERAGEAWSQRLTELGEALQGSSGMSDRAARAWTDRLSGLAEHLAAGD